MRAAETRAADRLGPWHERGQVLIALLLVFALGIGTLVYAFTHPVSLSLTSDRKTAAALAQARDALIGYAAKDTNRPGSLPCPDTNNNGSSALYAGLNCPSYIGRLPWRTLGLPDMRDGSAERLWYAVSPSYARNPLGAPPLNTDTPGEISVTGAIPASQVIAVIFAPGSAIGTQRRDGPGNQNDVANYLEGGNEVSGTTTFTAAPPVDGFNDRLIALTNSTYFRVVERRVARAARAALLAFYNANGFYPFANPYADATYRCAQDQLTGRIPRFFSDACKADPSDPDWKNVSWPTWFFSNNWHEVFLYAVAEKCAKPSSPSCTGTGALLTVNAMPPPNDDIHALLIMAGPALPGQNRPCAAVTDCLENPENRDSDNIYVSGPNTPDTNDRLLVVAP